ncbi:MAG: transcription elongation factor Spt5 [Candidatus Anstonellales archaeon]
MIFPIRVTYGQEKIVASTLEGRVKTTGAEIYSITYIDRVKGYLFVEAKDEDNVIKLINKVRHVKGLLRKGISKDELFKMVMLEPAKEEKIEVGDIVEIKSGGMKGEKGKVIKIDAAKEDITVEPIEVAVPIPIKLKLKNVKLLQKK